MRVSLENFFSACAFLIASVATFQLFAQTRGVEKVSAKIGDIPATIWRKSNSTPAPVIVIAHGFSGSQQLMAPMATTLAQNGYVAVTFDFSGHGRNPVPMAGGLKDLRQSTDALLSDIEKVVDNARHLPFSDGRIAIAGHSMATDLVVRHARRDSSIEAVVALSFFAQEVTPDNPRNLLIVDGAWESQRLIDVGLRIVSATAKEPAQPGVTYGDIGAGTGRRLALARGAEHIGVLFSEDALSESVAWLNTVFGHSEAGFIDRRGKWLAFLFIGLIALARPMARLLPVMSPLPLGAGLPWRRLAPVALAPALLTPLLLWKIPTDAMPLLLGDYLAAHLGLYGLLTVAGLRLMGRKIAIPSPPIRQLAVCSLAIAAYYTVILGLPLDAYVVSFFPTTQRALLIPPIFVCCALFFLTNDWMASGEGAAPGGYVFGKLCFIVSLGIAVALNPRRLFFLIIIAIVVVILLTIYGLVSRWVYARTRDPRPGALGAAFGLAWAIAVCFPIVD